MKFLRALHRSLGVAVAAYVAVAALSGALLLWTDEYVAWRHPGAAAAIWASDPRALAPLLGRIEAVYPGAVRAIGLPRAARPVFHLYRDNAPEQLLHPATGAVLGDWTSMDALPAFLFDLHAHLLAGDPGHTLVGVLGLIALVSLGSGIVLWLPQRRRPLLRDLWPSTGRRSELLRAHAAQGLVLGVLLIVAVGSGVTMVFDAPVRSALDATLGAKGPQRPSAMAATVTGSARRVSWLRVLEQARATFPEAELRFVMPPRRPGEPVVLRLRQPEELHPNGRSYLVIDPLGGGVLEAIDARGRGLGPAVFDALYPLHAGRTGWWGHRAVLVLVAASLLFIALSGLWAFARPRQARRRATSTARHRVDGTSAADLGRARRGPQT